MPRVNLGRPAPEGAAARPPSTPAASEPPRAFSGEVWTQLSLRLLCLLCIFGCLVPHVQLPCKQPDHVPAARQVVSELMCYVPHQQKQLLVKLFEQHPGYHIHVSAFAT